MKNLKEEAYRLYQLDWFSSHGYSVKDFCSIVEEWRIDREMYESEESFEDYLFERGFGGSIWACFDEFLGAEYQDPGYMMCILPTDLYDEYLKEKAGEKFDDALKIIQDACECGLLRCEDELIYVSKRLTSGHDVWTWETKENAAADLANDPKAMEMMQIEIKNRQGAENVPVFNLSKPENGWTEVHVCGRWIGSASYLRNVALDCLNACLRRIGPEKVGNSFYLEFDGEGYQFGITEIVGIFYYFTTRSEYGAELVPIPDNNATFFEDFTHQVCQIVSENLDDWAAFDVFEEDETAYRLAVDENENQIREKMKILNEKVHNS